MSVLLRLSTTLVLALLAASADAQEAAPGTTWDPDAYPEDFFNGHVGLVEVLTPASEAGVFVAGTCSSQGFCPVPDDGGFGPFRLVLSTDPGRPDRDPPIEPGMGCAGFQDDPDAVAGAVILYRRPSRCDPTQLFYSIGGGRAALVHQDERVGADDDSTLFNLWWHATVSFNRVGMTLSRYRGERLRAAIERGEEVVVMLRRSNVATAAEDGPQQASPLALRVAPNPVRGRAAVRYAVGRAGPVRLAVYDVLGREVARLVDGAQAAGEHTAVLDARGLAPGLYVARLVTSERAEMIRFTVTR